MSEAADSVSQVTREAAPASGGPPGEGLPTPVPEVSGQPWRWLALAVGLAVLGYVGLTYLVQAMTHESTDDAFIAGHVVAIAPRIEGQVVAVHVRDNQMVRSNDLLVEIDPATYATTLSQRQAATDSEGSSYKAALAGYALMQQKVKTAQAVAQSSQADVAAAAATATKARADFERARSLVKDQTISAQEFDQAKAGVDKAEADLNSARQKAASDESKVDEAAAQKDAAWAEAGSVLAQSRQAATQVDSARLNLSYASIFAPSDGRVTRKQVEVGDYLQTGQQIMSLVPTEVWVTANFKESQLKQMAPGQPVRVAIDALDGRTFRAHVDSIQAGSGALFSMLPPENATGNFVKVVQRVPVKIVFDEPLPTDHVIGPGLSVTPSVRVSAFRAPAWAVALAAVALALVVTGVIRLVAGRRRNGK